MKYIKTIKTIGLLLCTCFAFAQDLPQIVSPTPEVAQLTKFIETPVNYSNGLPTISIPIYTIVQDGVSIPITLDYHARGVKVDEVASNVGLGWALNGGGIISRQIRGIPDERGLLNYQGSYLLDAYENETTRRQIIASQALGSYDFDYYTPDQFFFSFPGGSGKFIFDYVDKKPVIQNQSKGLKIESFNTNSLDKFEITDKTGNKYFFGESQGQVGEIVSKEQSLQDFTAKMPDLSIEITNGTGNNDISGWYLTNIETVNKSFIEFKYAQNSTIYYKRSYDKKETGNNLTSYFSKIRSEENAIEEIIFEKGKIVFEYSPDSTPREDITYGKKLEWISVYDNKDTLLKKIKLNYFYSNNTSSQNILPYLYNVDPQARKRLFLESVEEINILDANEKNTYSFQYNLSSPMPNRHSNSKDLWGYYNGANNGNSILSLETGIGDRRVNSTLCGVGMLNKITYPTGGFTKYFYEDNIVSKTNKLNEVVLAGDPNPEVPVDIKDAVLSNLENGTFYNGSIYRKPFTVGENAVHFKYKLSFTDNTACQTGSEQECKFNVWIQSVDRQQNISLVLTPGTDNTINYILPAGEYYMVVQPRFQGYDPFDMNDSFYLRITWEEISENTSNEFFAGGKRIQKIEKHDTETEIAFQKEYEYKNDDGTISGRLNGLPDFVAVKRTVNLNGQNVPIVEYYSSGQGSPISAYQGNAVSYTQVAEYSGSKGSNIGKSVYTFTDLEDTGDYWLFPYNIPTDNDWLRGLLLKERHYSFVNQQYQLKKQIENKYTYGLRDSEYNPTTDEGVLGGMSPGDYTLFPPVYTLPMSYNITDSKYKYKKENGYFRIPFFLAVRSEVDAPNPNVDKYWTEETFPPAASDLETSNSNPYYLYYKTFFVTGGFVNIGKTITTDYYDTGNLVTETEYKYQNEQHLQMTEQITTYSTGSIVKSKYTYAHELNNQALIDKNMIGIPLVTKSYKNNLKLGLQETLYKDWGNGLLAPEIIKTAKGNETSEVRIKYNAIDNTNGNPLEVQQESGIPIAYIWGYNKTQPIAKIENATYAQVLPYVANLQTLSNGTNEANLITALDNLRTALPNAMVTTYTYKPLVGISTITDPKGNTVTYHYDDFNRLEFVKDKNGNILSENEYHYKN
ncbi:RHS repeat protein [Flavobacterium jejuense]|uniref:RHS repeat protein n=1 Tax=Flavobacterium jejuense TaxID=1544455 RepID=A0ABX0IW94_9FLAO|nr:RHS repeat protein [Flavobacterium jejuense]NHN28162.1 RHS repeat protein [Flavobacterium jejuense]